MTEPTEARDTIDAPGSVVPPALDADLAGRPAPAKLAGQTGPAANANAPTAHSVASALELVPRARRQREEWRTLAWPVAITATVEGIGYLLAQRAEDKLTAGIVVGLYQSQGGNHMDPLGKHAVSILALV